MKNTTDKYKISEIIAKHHLKICNADEENILSNWLHEKSEHKELYNTILNKKKLSKKMESYLTYDSSKALKEERSIPENAVSIYKQIIRYAAIFILPLTIAGSLLWYFNPNNFPTPKQTEINIPPGYSKAILKMANGTLVHLENKKFKNLKEKDGTIITNDSKILSFKIEKRTTNLPPPVMEEISIPRKGEYQIILPDRTKVWLNSETILEFPSRFTGKERHVTLKKGEAFFEVAHNKDYPFIVTTKKSIVKVFGTSFNISAYEDDVENITTLVDGSISLSHRYDENSTIMLKPGDQASIISVNRKIKKEKVDVKFYTAWMNGEFIFNKTPINQVVKKFSRWYDIDFVFENEDAKTNHFTGTLKRYENISELLELIQYSSKLTFEKQENTIYIK